MTKEDLKSAIEEIYPNYVSAYDVYDENADDLGYVLDNQIYNRIYDTKTGIGSCYVASSSDIISTAGIDTHTQGASITLPAGVYVVTAQWVFNTRSSSANTNSQCSIKNLDTGSIISSQRYFASGYNYNVIQTGGMWPIANTTRLAVMGSSSITYTSETTNWIHAVKIADYHM